MHVILWVVIWIELCTQLVESCDCVSICVFQMRVSMEGNLNVMADAQSACDRIINTPTPFPYLIQIRQLLMMFLATLPVVFQGQFKIWISIPATAFIALGLFGIEEAGKIIEDPFGDDPADLPLENYCALIEKDCTHMLTLQEELKTFRARGIKMGALEEKAKK
jgi:putative membrane protein